MEAGINAARTYLPANLPANPTYRKVNPADSPIMILGLTSDKYDRTSMYDAASTVMEQKLSQIQGVGQVNVGGGSLPVGAGRGRIPTQLASYGIDDGAACSAVLSLQNSDLPRADHQRRRSPRTSSPTTRSPRRQTTSRSIVGYHNGAAVRLTDVADVIDSAQNMRTAGLPERQARR